MPKYTYECKKCKNLFSCHHSISELLENCEKCGTKESLIRKPSSFSVRKQKEERKHIGDAVKKAIEEFKSDLDDEKKSLREHIWSSDD